MKTVLPRIIKYNTYEYDPEAASNPDIIPIHRDTVIKRGFIQYSIPEKVKLGLLPPEALYYYQMEEERKKALEEALAEDDDSVDSDDELDLNSNLAEAGLIYQEGVEEELKKEAHTFWQEENYDEKLMQDSAYQQFLAEHALDLPVIQQQIESLLKER